MSTRLAALWLVLIFAYCGLIAWPAARLCQASGLGGWGLALGLLVVTISVVAPVVLLTRAFVKGRRGRFQARFRAYEGLFWGGIFLSSIGGFLGSSGLGLGRAVENGLSAVGIGLIFWAFLRSIPVGEPPDEVMAPA